MQSILLKLQADVAARKRARSEPWPVVRVAGVVLGVFLLAFELGARSVDTSAGWAARVETKTQMDALSGQVDLQKTQIERFERAYRLSSRYGIGADLALAIEEIALAEGIEPKLAFDLVRVESEFRQKAVSPVGAIGYTQLMPETARLLSPGITRQQIFDRDTNLRLGFRFFKSLLQHYDGNVRLALLAYNRGPTKVDRLLTAGVDPNNGYARKVLGR